MLRSKTGQALPLIKLYQLKSLKFKGFKSKMSRIKLLHQIVYCSFTPACKSVLTRTYATIFVIAERSVAKQSQS